MDLNNYWLWFKGDGLVKEDEDKPLKGILKTPQEEDHKQNKESTQESKVYKEDPNEPQT